MLGECLIGVERLLNNLSIKITFFGDGSALLCYWIPYLALWVCRNMSGCLLVCLAMYLCIFGFPEPRSWRCLENSSWSPMKCVVQFCLSGFRYVLQSRVLPLFVPIAITCFDVSSDLYWVASSLCAN